MPASLAAWARTTSAAEATRDACAQCARPRHFGHLKISVATTHWYIWQPCRTVAPHELHLQPAAGPTVCFRPRQVHTCVAGCVTSAGLTSGCPVSADIPADAAGRAAPTGSAAAVAGGPHICSNRNCPLAPLSLPPGQASQSLAHVLQAIRRHVLQRRMRAPFFLTNMQAVQASPRAALT